MTNKKATENAEETVLRLIPDATKSKSDIARDVSVATYALFVTGNFAKKICGSTLSLDAGSVSCVRTTEPNAHDLLTVQVGQ